MGDSTRKIIEAISTVLLFLLNVGYWVVTLGITGLGMWLMHLELSKRETPIYLYCIGMLCMLMLLAWLFLIPSHSRSDLSVEEREKYDRL